MALSKLINYPLIFLLGIFCLIYGFGGAYIEQRFLIRFIFFVALGLFCILYTAAHLMNVLHSTSKSVSMRKYIFIFFIGILFGSLFIVVNYLAIEYDQRFDMTKAKQHTLDQMTVELLENISHNIKITALTVGLPPKYLEDLLNEYERQSKGKVKAEIIDPLVQLGYASQFGNVISGKESKAIVQSGSERQDVDFTEKPLSEESLNNAIVRVTRKARRAYFLAGHQENDIHDNNDRGFSRFNKQLLANNVLSSKLLLDSDSKVPEDCDILIVSGVRDHLREKEETIIKEYLDRGGDALFLVEHTIVTTLDKPLREEELNLNPDLNNILGQWGIKVASDVVVDLASHASGDVGSPATRNYLTHKAIVKDLDYTFYVRPRSIAMTGKRRRSVRVAPLVLTASDKASWGETDRTLNVKYDDILDRPGPVPIAYVIFEGKDDAKEIKKDSDTRIIVFTDSDFLTNAYIDHYSNAEMGLNVVNWLTEMDYQVLVSKKDIEVERLDLTSRQKRQVAMILFMMPVFIGTWGMMGWIKQV